MDDRGIPRRSAWQALRESAGHLRSFALNYVFLRLPIAAFRNAVGRLIMERLGSGAYLLRRARAHGHDHPCDVDRENRRQDCILCESGFDQLRQPKIGQDREHGNADIEETGGDRPPRKTEKRRE